MGQLLGFIPWDDSKGFLDNIGGGIADNTVERIPGWDSSKGVADNVVGGVQDGINSVSQTVKGLAGDVFGTLRKYWYVPVIVGGVIIGYKLIKQPNPQLIAALSKIRMPE